MPSCLYRPPSSAPCKPETVQVNLECSTNKALVTWENVGPDQTQEVSAVDSRGTITTCNSSSSNCTFDQLTCGETYVINVVGHTNTCSSEPVISGSLSAGKSLLLLRGPDGVTESGAEIFHLSTSSMCCHAPHGTSGLSDGHHRGNMGCGTWGHILYRVRQGQPRLQ